MSRKRPDDPYAQREADNYENPIPSREFILDYLKENGRPLSREQLSKRLNLSSEDDREALRRRLRAMERDGQLLFNKTE